MELRKDTEIPQRLNHILPALPCARETERWIRNRNKLRALIEMFKRASRIFSYVELSAARQNLQAAPEQVLQKKGKDKVVVAGISDVYISKQAERYMYRWLKIR